MQKITHSKLVEILAQSKGALPVGILATTDAKARKTGNPFGVIFKTSRSVGFVGANYEKAVRREGERQGSGSAETFVAQARPWGVWVIPNKLAEHKGKLYLRTQSTPGQRERQRAKVCYRGENGQFLSRDEVSPFLPEKSYSRRQAEVGIENEGEQVDVREFAFDSIQKIRIKGRTFELVHYDSFDLLNSLYARREANEGKPGF